MEYGRKPTDLGAVEVKTGEMMFYLYLPIKLPEHSDLRLEPRLQHLSRVTDRVVRDARKTFGKQLDGKYIYLTAKTLWVEPGAPGNRPGWHVDGWGSDGDINYLWYDQHPTEFCIQEFTDIPDDDIASLEAFEEQADPSNIWVWPIGHLLRIDESVVHRVSLDIHPGVRTFIKFSVSDHRYNLAGNSHNYEFDYDWELFDRGALRNLDNKDFVK